MRAEVQVDKPLAAPASNTIILLDTDAADKEPSGSGDGKGDDHEEQEGDSDDKFESFDPNKG